MTNSPQLQQPAREAGRVTPLGLVVLALIGLALTGLGITTVGHFVQRDDAAASATHASTADETTRHTQGPPVATKPAALAAPDKPSRATRVTTLGEGGLGSQGVSVFDSKAPSIAGLDPDLLAALKEAALDAADDGITFDVNSGWRSAAYQERLLQDAIAKYGSEAEARRWVATPETSEHVSGDAVDLGPTKAATWLAKHGAHYGLCQIYRNEPWHFELRPAAVNGGCPAMYADPTQDPRMQQ